MTLPSRQNRGHRKITARTLCGTTILLHPQRAAGAVASSPLITAVARATALRHVTPALLWNTHIQNMRTTFRSDSTRR